MLSLQTNDPGNPCLIATVSCCALMPRGKNFLYPQKVLSKRGCFSWIVRPDGRKKSCQLWQLIS